MNYNHRDFAIVIGTC